ncbi:MAG: type IV pilin protein [Gammaproteobacteria bacterium]
MRKNMQGMTLIELITVMLIVGILTAIAVPSYRAYIIRSNRTEAKVALLSTAGAFERCFTRFNKYDQAGCVTLPVPTEGGNYSISLGAAPAPDTFSLKAEPQGEQAKDTGCKTLTLNSAGARGATGTKPQAECWGR